MESGHLLFRIQRWGNGIKSTGRKKVFVTSRQGAKVCHFLAVLSFQLLRPKLGIIFDSFFFLYFIPSSSGDPFASIFRLFPESDGCHHLPTATLVHALSSGRGRACKKKKWLNLNDRNLFLEQTLFSHILWVIVANELLCNLTKVEHFNDGL